MTETYTFDHSDSPSADTPPAPGIAAPWGIQTTDPALPGRIRREGIFGLGEAYVEGRWTTPRLDQLMYKVITTPEPRLSPLVYGKLLVAAAKVHLLNRQAGKRAFDIGLQHYDLGNDLFRVMLDPSMTYTSGYWAGATTLAEAQEAKLELLCQKLKLRPGMRVLDIGCGWGNFARHAATHHGVNVVGITVSQQQADEAKRRCADLSVDIRLQDYRSVAEQFDRIVSIEMIEAVGKKNIATYYRCIDRCLKLGGLFALQAITTDLWSRTSNRQLDQYLLWLQTYIFPEGYIPNQTELATAGGSSMRIESWENFGPDYDRTLLAWADNFARGWDRLKSRYSEEFRRRWEFYLFGCAAAFRSNLLRVGQVVYSKG